ncbi:MAG: hypothetical protein LBC35_04560 [Coriobacteriales bacterium]|jgi:ribosomal protein S25|nr:hypothetical protein [Coriobacteriales bacterium]
MSEKEPTTQTKTRPKASAVSLSEKSASLPEMGTTSTPADRKALNKAKKADKKARRKARAEATKARDAAKKADKKRREAAFKATIVDGQVVDENGVPFRPYTTIERILDNKVLSYSIVIAFILICLAATLLLFQGL